MDDFCRTPKTLSLQITTSSATGCVPLPESGRVLFMFPSTLKGNIIPVSAPKQAFQVSLGVVHASGNDPTEEDEDVGCYLINAVNIINSVSNMQHNQRASHFFCLVFLFLFLRRTPLVDPTSLFRGEPAPTRSLRPLGGGGLHLRTGSDGVMLKEVSGSRPLWAFRIFDGYHSAITRRQLTTHYPPCNNHGSGQPPSW